MASQYTQAPITLWLTNLALFGVGSLVMRGAGCIINDMWDAEMDAKVDRTKDRPIASGAVTHAQAFALLGIQLSAGLGILLNLNTYRYAIFFPCSNSALYLVHARSAPWQPTRC